MSKKIVVIGLDGVPYSLIKDLSEKNVMPNIKQLIDRFDFRQIKSTLPEISSVAWPSIITGKGPAEHGAFGFTDFLELSYKIYFPNFSTLKAKPFWKEREDLKYEIINVPSTYPAQTLNGTLVSGFVSYGMDNAAYPKSLLPFLKEIDYKIDVDSEKAHKSMDAFIDDMDRTLDAREKFFKYTWDKRQDVFMFVFTETDRLFHFLWKAYENKKHKYHNYFLDFFKRLDSIIGEKLQLLRNDDIFVMLSDHGFELLEKDIYVNNYLKEKGILHNDCKFENMELNVNSSTRAFSLDPARIYVNSDERFPSASVKESEKNKVLEDLESLFLSWKIDNRNVISKIFNREETYDGPFKRLSPDLVLMPNKGFNLKSSLKTTEIYSDGLPFTGKHTYYNAFMITNGNIDFSDDFSVIDAGKMIKKEVLGL